MKEERFTIQNIPSILYGDSSENLFLYIHGKMGCKEEAARFAETVCPEGYQVLSADLPGHGARTGEADAGPNHRPQVLPVIGALFPLPSEQYQKVTVSGADVKEQKVAVAFLK